MKAKPLHSALILALLSTSMLSACNRNANLTEQQLIQRAKDFEDKGDIKASVIELKNALQKNPNSPQARLLLGQVYLHANMGPEAENELNKAAKLGISSESIKPLMGQALLLMGKYDRVLAEIQPDASTSNLNRARIYQMRGEALLKTGKLTEACNLFQQSLNTDTQNPPTYWGLAQCAVADQHMDKAKAWLDTAIKLDPKNARSWLYIGDWEQINNNNDGALMAYSNAVKSDPNSLEALNKRATLNITLNHLDAAKADIDKINTLAPHSLLAEYSHALLAFRQHNFPVARDALQEVFQIAPDYLPGVLLSGAVNYSLGSYEQAASQLSQVIDKLPDNLYARKLLAATQSKLGLNQAALETLQPLSPAQSNDAQLLALAANINLKAKNYALSNQLLQKAASLDPSNAAIRTGLGVSLLASGETEKALADLQSAATLNSGSDAYQANMLLVTTLLNSKQYDRALLAIDDLDKKKPNDPLTYDFRGGAYLGKNDIANARKNFEKALALKPDFYPAAANLAQLDMRANNPAAARARFEGILKQDKTNLQAMMALADLANASKQDAEYHSWLEKALKAHPEAMPVRIALTRYFLMRNDTQKALTIANDGVNSYPDSAEALALLGATQMATNNNAAAVSSFTRRLNKTRPTPEAYLTLARAQIANQNMDDARKSIQSGLALDSTNLPLLDTLIGMDLVAKKFDAALATAQQIESKYPGLSLGYEREGDAQVALKRLPLAIKAYTQAVSKGADSLVFIKLTHAQIATGLNKEAEQSLLSWLQKHPKDNAVRAFTGEYYSSTGRYKEAIATYLEIDRQAPNNASILNNLANLFQLTHDNRATATAERALKLAPDSPAIQDTLGWILVSQGQASRGLTLLRTATASMPKDPSVRYHYAAALAATGNKAQARVELAALLRAYPSFPESAAATSLLKSL